MLYNAPPIHVCIIYAYMEKENESKLKTREKYTQKF